MLRGELTLPSRVTGLVVREIPLGHAAFSLSASSELPAPSSPLPLPSGNISPTVALARTPAATRSAHDALMQSDYTAAAPGSAAAETLVFFADRIHVLEGGFGARPFRLGPQLQLTDAGSGTLHRLCDSTPCAIYEPLSGSVLFVEGYAIMRLDARNMVSLLAGSSADCALVDGPPRLARFQHIRTMATDGRGTVYVAETQCIRKLTVTVTPSTVNSGGNLSRNSSSSSSNGSMGTSFFGVGAEDADVNLDASPGGNASHGDDGGGGDGGGAIAGVGNLTCTAVLTLLGSTPPRDRWYALMYDHATDFLLAATDTAIFRLLQRQLACECVPAAVACKGAIDRGGTHLQAAATVAIAAAAAPAAALQLVAGNENIRGHVDTRGSAVRFHSISALLPTGDGTVLITDDTSIRQLDVQTGDVRTALPEGTVRYEPSCLAVLPQGCLAVGNTAYAPNTLLFLGIGFRQAAVVPGRPLRSSRTHGVSNLRSVPLRLCREMLMLPPGDRNRDRAESCIGAYRGPVSAMVIVRVGELQLVAHRAVLSTGSDYFQQLLEGGFKESAPWRAGIAVGGAPEVAPEVAAAVELPEADPDAFAALLCYLYTGSLEVPEQLLRPATELAGRLLMTDARVELQRRLLAVACPETVVEDLMWAERHNMDALLEGLVMYYAENSRRVAAAAPTAAALRRLAEDSPGLAGRLLLAVSAFRW